MADKPEPLQYVEAALKTPGRGASICFVVTVVAGVWIGVDSIRPIFSELPQIRSLVWLFLLGAPIVGVVLALLHYGTERKRPAPIPDFEIPTLAKPMPPVDPNVRPQIVDSSTLHEPAAGTPRARFEAAAKAAEELAGETPAFRQGYQRAVEARDYIKDGRIPRDPQTGEIRRGAKVTAQYDQEGKFASVKVENLAEQRRVLQDQQRDKAARFREKIDKSSDRARLYLQYIRAHDLKTVEGWPADPTIQELIEAGFLAMLAPGNARNVYAISPAALDAIKTMPPDLTLLSLETPPWEHLL